MNPFSFQIIISNQSEIINQPFGGENQTYLWPVEAA
jgi:hypothetical protein